MTNPYLPNPPAAGETSAELANIGNRLDAAVQDAIGRIRALGDPWGDDEAGNAYRTSIGNTDDIQQAMGGLGKSVTGFGSLATSGIQRILQADDRSGQTMGDIRI